METQADIIDTIAKHLGVTPADVELDSALSEDMGLSPIEVADLLNVLANRFKVTINPADTQNLRTIGDLVVLVEDLLLE